jgi:hypothetical protein
MRSQVSAELLIVIAVLADLAVYVFNQMQSSTERMSQKYGEAQSKLEKIVDDLTK